MSGRRATRGELLNQVHRARENYFKALARLLDFCADFDPDRPETDPVVDDGSKFTNNH
jgi:hypothetical protein